MVVVANEEQHRAFETACVEMVVHNPLELEVHIVVAEVRIVVGHCGLVVLVADTLAVRSSDDSSVPEVERCLTDGACVADAEVDVVYQVDPKREVDNWTLWMKQVLPEDLCMALSQVDHNYRWNAVKDSLQIDVHVH